MAITPQQDNAKIRSVILNDAYILSLGFNNLDTYNTNTTDEKLVSGKKQIFIYNSPSRDNYSNSETLEVLVQIDISVPVEKGSIANLCAEQIIALLHNYDIGNGSVLKVVSPSPSAMACQSSFYCVGVRFSYFVSKFNKVKTV